MPASGSTFRRRTACSRSISGSCWSAGPAASCRRRATASSRREQARFSIPFFYEPRVDARIAPLPIAGGGDFAPFLYGDYLWESATNFVEMAGVKDLQDAAAGEGGLAVPRRPVVCGLGGKDMERHAVTVAVLRCRH